MIEKARDNELEQVKTLLRRLEEEPVATSAEPASPIVTVVPRLDPGFSQHAHNDAAGTPIVASPARQLAASGPTPASSEQPPPRISLTRWLAGGAVVVGGCASLFLAWPHISPSPIRASHTSASDTASEKGARAEQIKPAAAAPAETVSAVTGPAPDLAVSSAVRPPGPPAPVVTKKPVASVSKTPDAAGATAAGPTTVPGSPAGDPAQVPEAFRATGGAAAEVHKSEPAPRTSAVAPAAVAATPPVPAPPGLPDAAQFDEELQRILIDKGRQVLAQGHVASARLLFRRAADAGSGEAALQLGDTFDPARLRSLGARGVTGDIAQSIRWYEKADELGAAAAKERLLGLADR